MPASNVAAAWRILSMCTTTVSLAFSQLRLDGVLFTGSHNVSIDSVALTDTGRVVITTAGWEGTPSQYDTFSFGERHMAPMQAKVYARIDGNQIALPIGPPIAPDSFYPFSVTPPDAKVKFRWYASVQEPTGEIGMPVLLEIVPSIVTTSAAINVPMAHEVVILDGAGNIVRRLPPAGTLIIWHGENDAGARLAPGIYFCRLLTSSGATVRKIVLQND